VRTRSSSIWVAVSLRVSQRSGFAQEAGLWYVSWTALHRVPAGNTSAQVHERAQSGCVCPAPSCNNPLVLFLYRGSIEGELANQHEQGEACGTTEPRRCGTGP
jgi:hypothetical protein